MTPLEEPPLDAQVAHLLAEVTALQMTMLAIIKIHPNKPAVLAELDSMVALLQVTGTQLGRPGLPASLRDAFERFRIHLTT